ncbi:MAG TPA: prolyl oligopeptidase family serine peptidase [Gemmatimonadales bacterium]|nr:prolyl oligopeptidase family serine peptidase [Gemmatimonadales bacterium]
MKQYPAVRTEHVVDVLHGESIADPYRWLEDGESAETRAFTEAQNQLTASVLEEVAARPFIRARLEQLLKIGAVSAPTPARGTYFYQRRDGGQNQPVLYVRNGVNGPDRVLLDPNVLDPNGTTALDWFYPSDDGSLLAYGISENGSEESVLHLLDVRTGALGTERIPGTRACDLAWLPDNSGFYYTRYPQAGEVPEGEEQYHRAVYFHPLGQPWNADPLIHKPPAKESWPGVSVSDDGRWVLIAVARTFDQTDLFLLDRSSGGAPRPVVVNQPFTFDGQVVHGRLLIRSNYKGATYGLYQADPLDFDQAKWKELVAPQADAVLEGVLATRTQLAFSFLEQASSRLRLSALDGTNLRELPLPALGSLSGWGGEPDGDELFYGFSSYTVPPSVYRVDLATGTTALWRRVEADIAPERFEVRQVHYPSKDGTRISMFIVEPRGLVRDGQRPVYLNGYGGFNISMTPGFSRSLLMWLEQGGVVAIPNLRGGGEYGEAWHQAGMLANKQNSFDDFIAAAEYLIRERYTCPAKLVAIGGSNGGLLTGAVLTQRPDLFGAVVIQVPLLDMLRYHRFSIARLWIPEYGSADDADGFRWLRSYSPYHHVKPGTKYPAVLLATAESDTRVDPLHARKMAARLQAATSGDAPILLRLESQAGHGAGKPVSKVLDELVDTWSFIFLALGLEWR